MGETAAALTPDGLRRGLADAALAGDHVALLALADRLDETGLARDAAAIRTALAAGDAGAARFLALSLSN